MMIANAAVHTHVIDSRGLPNEVGIYFLQVAPTVWECHECRLTATVAR